MDELKTCKKCGSPNWSVWIEYNGTRETYRVECDDCEYKTKSMITEDAARKAWNRMVEADGTAK